jgi:hypothetical protein
MLALLGPRDALVVSFSKQWQQARNLASFVAGLGYEHHPTVTISELPHGDRWITGTGSSCGSRYR